MGLNIVGVRVRIFLWTKDVGHIAIVIGTNPYVSFVPDKSDPNIEPLKDKHGNPYRRTDVPGLTGANAVAYRYPGKLIRSLEEDKRVHGEPRQTLIFTIPYREIPTDILYKPVRASYQLFDAVKGDGSHNNCVNYVRHEIFAHMGETDADMEIKRKLMLIHTPQQFYNAIKTLGVLERLQATKISEI